jgi:homoserine dehydrogenase
MMLQLALIGFGNVGREFARLLLSRREWLRRSEDIDVEVLAIATKRHGSLLSDRALNLERVLHELEEKGTLRGYGPELTELSPLEIIERCDADIMVELTTLNIESGQPAIDHIKAAFRAGMSVITTNKGPLSFAYEDLRGIARSRGAQFRFEGTVMDGTPVFNLVEKTLPGCEITGICGILNSTTNYVLDEMYRGKDMEQALEDAVRFGIAEADPSMDIDGWDAAAKITTLANVLMEAKSSPRRVNRVGIRDLIPEAVSNAAREGRKIKLIAYAERVKGAVKTMVRPELLGPENLFWSVDGTSCAVTLKTDLMGEITVVESNPNLPQTAYAVFSDMVLIADSIKRGVASSS